MKKADREAADARPGLRTIVRPLFVLAALAALSPVTPAKPATRSPVHVSSAIARAAFVEPAAKDDTAGVAAQQDDSDWRTAGKRRSHLEISIFLLENLAYVSIISLIVFTGFGARLWVKLAKRFQDTRITRPIYLAGALILLGLIGLPFDIWRYFVSRSFGLSNQNWAQWLRDYAILEITGFVVAFPALLGIYWLIKRKPRTWWLWTWVATVPVIAVLLISGPYYAYIFNRFTPLKNKQLSAYVLSLASKAGVNVDAVYETDLSRQTRAANAYVAGLGSTKRIVLGDTLIRNFSEQEILFATAHEIGHYVLDHVLIGFAFTIAGAAVVLFLVQRIGEYAMARFGKGIGVRSAYDPAALFLGALIALILFLAGLPVLNSFSRYLEHRADEYAAQMTIPGIVRPEQAADAFEMLGRLALSDPRPNPIIEFLFWDHPSIDRREQFVLNFRR
ncbi:MAG TPA: M48 family metalloprotease [Blastocatellia bacterium]|nr:M48 family metalloprotease [Blastocatellia bacterium]